MLVFQRITSIFSRQVQSLWALMEQAFPRAERRDAAWHHRALEDEDFHCCALNENGEFIGLACFWVNADFVYLEHLAMAEDKRGQGRGSSAMKQLQRDYAKFTIVAEVEPPVDDVTRRRCSFYEKSGFIRLPDEHVQPAYHPDTEPVPLLLYAYDARANEEEMRALLPRFESYLRERVMFYRDCGCRNGDA